ncbi:MAG: conserved hypothetical exported protein [Bacteroidetes bacterium]|jgi:hypothetical protein|nr:conserved hypothetical exported protein [Bacteroidota bacterium]
MKTTIAKWFGCMLTVMLLASISPLSAQVGENFYTVSGVVKDAQTKKTLGYVNVSVPGTNIGTITNADGEFVLKIKSSLKAKEIEFSHLAYKNARIAVDGTSTETVVALIPNLRMLREIIVRPELPKQLIEQAMDRISSNYSKNADLFTGFYRETAQKGKRYIQISEAVVNLYKSSYDHSTIKDRVRIFKGRELLSQKASDTLAVKLMGGPTLAVMLDVVKNPDVLLDKEILPCYNYTMEDPVSIDNRMQYVISFKPNVSLPIALYNGKYFIDQETLAFTRVEFSLDMQDIDKATNMMLVKKPIGLRFKPSEFSFLITYKRQNGIYYLNYVRSEAKFKCDWKRRLFSSKYDLVSEMVATDRSLQLGEAISYKESFKSDQAFTDKIPAFYDNTYWENYNIIAPTESLDAAVNKLRKQK